MQNKKIVELLHEYFDLGVAEGREGRSHDTEASDAQRVLSEIEAEIAALSAPAPVKPYGYVYESTVRYFDGRGPQRKVDFSYSKKNISDDDIEEFEISETAVYSAPVQDAAGWQSMDTAPKDGTRILIWFVHPNARFSKDPVAEGWAAAHEAYWTDHNRGGWTWHGLCGAPTLWQHLPAAPTEQER